MMVNGPLSGRNCWPKCGGPWQNGSRGLYRPRDNPTGQRRGVSPQHLPPYQRRIIMQRANLFLHCGACAASREQVKTTQTPARTATWVPIPHGQLLTGVQACLERAGLSIVSESHGLTRDGLRYFGLLQVANGDNPDDFGLVVGVRNSHDKSFPAALALGASVFVCDNLSFSGEVKLARKHTTYIERDLPQLVDRAVGLLGGLRRTQEQRFLAYKSHELTEG